MTELHIPNTGWHPVDEPEERVPVGVLLDVLDQMDAPRNDEDARG